MISYMYTLSVPPTYAKRSSSGRCASTWYVDGHGFNPNIGGLLLWPVSRSVPPTCTFQAAFTDSATYISQFMISYMYTLSVPPTCTFPAAFTDSATYISQFTISFMYTLSVPLTYTFLAAFTDSATYISQFMISYM